MNETRPPIQPDWYRTDNAGRIFASLHRWQITSVFRVSASLHEPVNLSKLESSLRSVLARLPYFNVHLRQGFFWCFFEPVAEVPAIHRDSMFPCNEFRYRHRQSPPFRVRVFHNRIALEVAHVLTDGTGALTFLRLLLADYFEIPPWQADEQWLQIDQDFDTGETEDAFRKYHRPGLPAMAPMERAFQIPGEFEPRGIRHICTGVFRMPEVLSLAKSHGATVGEFFISAYLYSFYQLLQELPPTVRKRMMRPIRLDVPVNLRTRLPSKTMRNFFLPTYPEIDPRLGDYSFEEILRHVHHFMKGAIREKYFLQMIGRNVGAEQNPFLRSVPLFLKNLILPEIYTRWSLSRATSGFSNLGRVVIPDQMIERVERFDFVPTHPSSRGINCGMISYGDRLHVSINRILTEPDVERHFFRFLSRMDLHIRIETNQLPDY